MISIYTGKEAVPAPIGQTCAYCSEMATEVDQNGMLLCGIPGNHVDLEAVQTADTTIAG